MHLLVRVLVSFALLAPLGTWAAGMNEALASHSASSEAERPRTVLLLGDSLIVTSFGSSLERFLNEQPGVHAVRRAKSSTGLARPDFFNWMKTGQEEVARHRPDIVVVILGGNDGQGLTDDKGKAVAQWGTAGWEAAYRQRVEDFLHVLEAPGRKILWLELPVTGLRGFESKLKVIRRVMHEVASGREDVTHLETRPFFIDAKGGLLQEARVDTFRKPMRLRMADGIHFTEAGGRYFASKVHPSVMELLESLEESAPAEELQADEAQDTAGAGPTLCQQRDPVSQAPVGPLVYCSP